MDIITTHDLTKYYGKSLGITNMNLSVEKGEFFGFIGPNGAGKSTTIRTLLGFISPTSGSAEVFGKDIIKENKSILQDTGYLPSEAFFYNGMKVKDVIKFSANLRKMNCSKEADILCDRLQLDTSKRVNQLSFGNKKKLAIVCALQSNPSLLILDEPTGGLDPLMQHEFFNILRERNKKGTTILFSSHILSEVQNNCTRAAVIREGEIIACDNIEALSKSNAKKISITGNVDLSGLEGIKDLKVTGGSDVISESCSSAIPCTTTFLYNGDINLLLNRLSDGDITDLNISEPDLEEIFMHYYEKDGDI